MNHLQLQLQYIQAASYDINICYPTHLQEPLHTEHFIKIVFVLLPSSHVTT